ncbi:MAG: hypothetical protein J3Q66DRAFT_404425 [Benniella sp.]|nr:MAG: hypothetical protein J3Q66DRAFT_404425 [Benniella sp.]
MLDIQELDDLVCQKLSQHDLAQCARVNKKWHSVVIPHLWGDLTLLEEPGDGTRGFIQMVLKDYLKHHLHQALQDTGRSIKQLAKTPLSFSHKSVLSKYGPWIRLLPSPQCLKRAFRFYRTGESGVPESELILHLCKQSSPDNAQVKYLSVSTLDLDLAPRDSQRAMYEFMLPRARQLYIHGRLSTSYADMAKMINLLDQCSGTLKRLDMNLGIPAGTSEIFKLEEGPTDIQPRAWASFKELTLLHWMDGSFWTWFFKQCRRVETLEVCCLDGTAQVLAQFMLTHMPHLTKITLGSGRFSHMKDDDVAILLAGSTSGWRHVVLRSDAHPGKQAMDALEEHMPTLETLEFNGVCRGFWSENTLPFLRSCPLLQSFVNTDRFTTLDVKTFIDRDSVTDTLRPWDCERTLKVLRLAITGIPRRDWPGYSIEGGSWFSQGYEIHNGLFDRLARLNHLEVLWLGSHSHGNDNESLELSLESGLYKLYGLQQLRELHFGLSTKIGIQDVQWMVESWPRLRVIDGLDVDGVHEEVVGWLRKIHPEISVVRTY